MDFFDFHPYSPGDEDHVIDWRATARRGSLMVRRFHEEAGGRWYICLDCSASMGVHGGEKWLFAVRLAAVFLHLLLHRSNRAGLILFSDRVEKYCPAARGRKQFKRGLFTLIGTPSPRGVDSRLESCVARLGRRSSAIVISDFLTNDAMRNGLDAVLQLGGRVHAIQVTSDRELHLGSGSAFRLRDVESGEKKEVFSDPAEATSRAAENLRRLQSSLSSHCRARSIPYSACTVDQDWRSVVIDHLIRASGGSA